MSTIAQGSSLNDVLASLGYTTRPAERIPGLAWAHWRRKDILRDGVVVFATASAGDVWHWLRESGQYAEAA